MLEDLFSSRIIREEFLKVFCLIKGSLRSESKHKSARSHYSGKKELLNDNTCLIAERIEQLRLQDVYEGLDYEGILELNGLLNKEYELRHDQ